MAETIQGGGSKRWVRLSVRWTVYVTLSLLLLYEANHCSLIEECSGAEAPGGALSHSDYGTIVKYGSARKPQSHRVVLVTLSAGVEPDEVLAKLCSQRLFIAGLIRRLNDLNVSVIALDKSYAPTSCNKEGEETQNTQAFIKAITASRAVITRGLPTAMLDDKQTVGEREVCLRETPTLALPIPPGNSGLLRLDADTRRIPVQWPVFQGDGKTVDPADTFALVTVRAADPEALDNPVLQKALKSGEQPYSTTIPFSPHSALALLCGRQANKSTTDWKTCATSDAWPEMNGAIVVIGDHNGDADKHPSLHGLTYGVDLQANYIAALLDQRYYLPAFSTFGNGAIIVVFFLGLQALLWKIGPLRAGAAGLAVWGVILVTSILVFALKGYLLTVWVQGINLVTIIVSCLEHWVAKME